MRVESGVEHSLHVASAPFPLALNKNPLFNVRGDIYANEVSLMSSAHDRDDELDMRGDVGV